MPTGYSIQPSPNARAMCKNKECKDSGVKIQKGELRFGTLVTIQEHTSWSYKHWGCVTPEQLKNLTEFLGGDMDLLEGYDELPQELQEKVDVAIRNGHVADEDWKGDVELNRPGMKGFRVKASKKKADKIAEEGDESRPKAKKKRGRAVKDDDEEAPAPKKARGKKAAVKLEDAAEEEETQPAKAKGRGKKAVVKEEKADEAEVKPKKQRAAKGRKPTVKDDPSDEPAEEHSEAEKQGPKAKRGKKQAATANDEKPAPQKRGRKKKAKAEEE